MMTIEVSDATVLLDENENYKLWAGPSMLEPEYRGLVYALENKHYGVVEVEERNLASAMYYFHKFNYEVESKGWLKALEQEGILKKEGLKVIQ